MDMSDMLTVYDDISCSVRNKAISFKVVCMDTN